LFNRRSVLAGIAAGLLAGCMNTQLLEENAAKSFAVHDVKVDTVQLQKGVTGRVNEFTPKQVAGDLDANLTRKLRARAQGSQPVDVKVSVTSVHLVSPGQSFLVGGVSTIKGIINVTDARTGELVLEPTQIAGTAKGNYAPGGIIGVVMTKQIDDDYRNTVAGFVGDVERLLFGKEGQTTATTVAAKNAPDPESDLSPEEQAAREAARARHSKCSKSVTIHCKDIDT